MTDLEFTELVRQMRRVQKAYFLYHEHSYLNKAKKLEKEVDRELEHRAMAKAPQQATLI